MSSRKKRSGNDMKEEITVKIAGQAGQGMQTIGNALCRIVKDSGYTLFANLDYMSRIRGGNNFFQLRIGRAPLFTLRRHSDLLVALDAQSIGLHKNTLAEGGIIVADNRKYGLKEDAGFFNVPFYKIAQDTGGSEIFVNSVASGIVAGMLHLDFEVVKAVIKTIFSDKDEPIITRNMQCAKEGYDFAVARYDSDRFRLNPSSSNGSLLINGNEALGIGAIAAGCTFYSAYPMTPSTSIMNFLAHYQDTFDIIVEQAEDELAAINMAIGASFAGARAMTATSGGGICLMTEGVSLAAMTETPVVIVDAQRPAPATGFPTRTEQGDLDLLLYAGHGEFARAIFSPGTIEDAFSVTVRAFDIAEKYQIPVFILTDQHLADSIRDIKGLGVPEVKVQRHIISGEQSKSIKGYKRYALTENGISPRAVPSWIQDVVYADSDEHTEYGHITEDADVRVKMVEKRFHKKMALLASDGLKPQTHNLEDAEIILVGFGSTYGVIKEVCQLRLKKKLGYVHYSQVWPLMADELLKVAGENKKIVVIENNAGGQLAGLIRKQTGIQAASSIRKFDGRPFDLDFLAEEIEKEG